MVTLFFWVSLDWTAGFLCNFFGLTLSISPSREMDNLAASFVTSCWFGLELFQLIVSNEGTLICCEYTSCREELVSSTAKYDRYVSWGSFLTPFVPHGCWRERRQTEYHWRQEKSKLRWWLFSFEPVPVLKLVLLVGLITVPWYQGTSWHSNVSTPVLEC